MPHADRLLALETAVLLGLARFCVLILPFRWVAAPLGNVNEDSVENAELPNSDKSRLRDIESIIRRVSRNTPWRSNCLAQAIAGQYMLRRRGIASTIFFGLSKDEKGHLGGHAWLHCGGEVLTGESDVDHYAVVATFTNKAVVNSR